MYHQSNVSKQTKFIPFRDSSLTMFLMEYFKGDYNITMITNINPSFDDLSDTICVLNQAVLTRNIKTDRLKMISNPISSKNKDFESNKNSEIFDSSDDDFTTSSNLLNASAKNGFKKENNKTMIELKNHNNILQKENENLKKLLNDFMREKQETLIKNQEEILQKVNSIYDATAKASKQFFSFLDEDSHLQKTYFIRNPNVLSTCKKSNFQTFHFPVEICPVENHNNNSLTINTQYFSLQTNTTKPEENRTISKINKIFSEEDSYAPVLSTKKKILKAFKEVLPEESKQCELVLPIDKNQSSMLESETDNTFSKKKAFKAYREESNLNIKEENSISEAVAEDKKNQDSDTEHFYSEGAGVIKPKKGNKKNQTKNRKAKKTKVKVDSDDAQCVIEMGSIMENSEALDENINDVDEVVVKHETKVEKNKPKNKKKNNAKKSKKK